MISIERLRNVDIFQGLSDTELEIAAGFCTEERIAGGTTLCEEGARAEGLYILEDGAVSIRFAKGASYAIQQPGKILGWSFLVPPNRYTASVVTLRPSRVLAIKSPDFYTLVNQEAKMGLRIMNNLAQVVAGRMKAFVDYY
jgi:CRP/FNR family transcriptional regulator, cyclic AMP receptor protein